MLKNHWNALKICLFGQTAKQPLSNCEPWKSWNGSNFEGRGLILVAYKKCTGCRRSVNLFNLVTSLFHKIIPQVVRSMSGFVMVYRTSTSNCSSSLMQEKITFVSQLSHKKSSKQFFLLLLFTTVVLADSYLKPIQFL